MPFNTKQAMIQTIADWMVRPDKEAQVPDWIQLAENDIERELDLTFQDDVATGTIAAGGVIALPADCLWPRVVRIDTVPPHDLEIISPDELNNLRDKLTGDFPQFAYRRGDDLVVAPSDGMEGTAYTLEFHKVATRLAAVGATEATDFLIHLYDLILYGALLHGAPYLKADARIETFSGFYERGKEGVKKLEFRRRTGGMVLRMRPARVA